MRVLAMDTACATASCAVLEDGKLLSEMSIYGARNHSRKLMPMVDALLKLLSMEACGMDVFAVTSGPGSFTGLRIGVVTAKGMAFAVSKPLVGIPTLEALAYSVPEFQGVVCPLVDARNGNAFCGFYERGTTSVVKLAPDGVLHVSELAEQLAALQRDVMLIGDCSKAFAPHVLERFSVEGGCKLILAEPDLFATRAAAVAVLAEKKWKSGDKGDPFLLSPDYMRASQAERLRAGGAT